MMTSKQKTKSLINKATTNDRNPPSGYILNELTSRTSSISECQTMEDLLLKKLSKNKAYIKYKTLRIIKHLSENGSVNWCRTWQRNKNKIIEAQQFHGPRDPIYGDAPFEQVRKAAKEALQSVFEQRPSHSPYIPYSYRKPVKQWINNTKQLNHSDKTKTKTKTKIKIKKSSGKFEKQWVHDIVQSAGIGWKIPDLSKYVKQFDNLSKKHILKELNEILTDSMWQKQAKSLVLIEGLMNGKSSNFVINYFNKSPDNVQTLQNGNKAILRRKANAIVEYLDVHVNQDKEKQDENVINESEKEDNTSTAPFIDLFETEEDIDVHDDMFSGMNVVKNDDYSNGDSPVLGLDNLDISVSSIFGTDLTNIPPPQHQNMQCIQNMMRPPQFPNAQCIHNNMMRQQPQIPQPHFLTQTVHAESIHQPAPRYHDNDPFAEIMNGVSTQTCFISEPQKKAAPNPFAEFAQFGVSQCNPNL